MTEPDVGAQDPLDEDADDEEEVNEETSIFGAPGPSARSLAGRFPDFSSRSATLNK